MELLNSVFPVDGLMKFENLDHELALVEVEDEALAILLWTEHILLVDLLSLEPKVKI